MTWALLLTATGIVAAFFLYASFSIRAGVYVKALCRKKTNKKVVSLTFDDGPEALYTPQILDILKQYQVQATFFCIGKKAEKQPVLLRRIQEEGHLIGNHSYSHSASFPFFPLKKMMHDLQQAQQILEAITNDSITLFRPPFGVTNPVVARAVGRLGYTVAGWNIRSFDTRGEATGKIYRRIITQLSPGSVILLHDRLPGSPELLVMLLDYLVNNNYKVVRTDTLFEIEHPTQDTDFGETG